MASESIETIIEEQIWYAKKMLEDNGKKPSLLRPFLSYINDPWEAVYWSMNDVKQILIEENLWKDTNIIMNAQAGEKKTQARAFK